MKKLHLTLLLAVLAFLFAACAPATIGDGDNDALIESDASAVATDCSGLTGDYQATRFDYTSVADPGVTSAFADTGASYRLGFNDGSFNSTFAGPADGRARADRQLRLRGQRAYPRRRHHGRIFFRAQRAARSATGAKCVTAASRSRANNPWVTTSAPALKTQGSRLISRGNKAQSV